jgi:hypothetical protein
VLMEAKTLDVLHHGADVVDVPLHRARSEFDRDGEGR